MKNAKNLLALINLALAFLTAYMIPETASVAFLGFVGGASGWVVFSKRKDSYIYYIVTHLVLFVILLGTLLLR